MSSSEETRPVALAVQAGDAEAEIFVVDGAWHLVGRGVGSLQASLPAGLYKVKVRTGPKSLEAFASLAPGREALVGDGSGATLERRGDVAVLSFPKTSFASAVPLADTSHTHGYHLAAAVQHSRQVHVARGRGSQVFFFARTWTPPRSRGQPPSGPEQAPRGAPPRLELCDLAGQPLVDLAREGASDLHVGDPWVACNVELDPGLYRLRLGTQSSEGLERLVVASAGWQAQAFLYQRLESEGGHPSRLGPWSASVLLRRLGEGFDPTSPDLRLTELARTGLRDHRSVVSTELLDPLLKGKLDNPMLGLYGAHLLLLSGDVDPGWLGEVVRALRAMLGGAHPDVESLGLALGWTPASPFAAPPMLLHSWSLIVRATGSRPDLVPRGSLAARIADRLWGEGPWLTWRAWASPEAEAAAGTPAGAGTAPDAAELLKRLRAAGPERLGGLGELKGLERLLAERLSASSRPPRRLPSRAARKPGADLTPAGLARAFGVPMASLEDAALRLLGRLQPAAEPMPG